MAECGPPGFVHLRTLFSYLARLSLFDEPMFGFNSGGTATVNATCSGNLVFPLTFVILTADQAEAPVGYIWNFVHVNQHLQLEQEGHKGCDLAFPHVRDVGARNRLSLNYTTTFGHDLRTGFYRFGLFLCAARNFPPAVNCHATLTLLNPGGEHLSSDRIALPNIYRGLVIYWLAIIGLHIFNTVIYRRYRNRLNDMAVGAPILALISAYINLQAWLEQSRDEDAEGTLDEALVASYATLCYSFFLIMVICYGFCILRPNFEPGRFETMVGVTVAAFLSMVCILYVHRYFLVPTFIMLVVIIVSILKNSGKNSQFLRIRLMEIEALTLHQLGSAEEFAAPLLAKRFMIAAARFIFIVYSILWTIEGVVDAALKERRDLQILLEELLIVFLVTSIVWVVRLRNFDRFVRPHTDRMQEHEEDATEARRPPCDVLILPGEKQCLGVQVTHEQLYTFTKNLRRKEAYDITRPTSREGEPD